MQDLTTIQLATLDPTGARQKLISRTNKDAFRPGDILQVRRKNGLQPFAGVLLNIRRRGVDSGILLRNTLTRVGVEMWFKLYSPTIEGFDIVQRKEKRAVRAKLYHMRYVVLAGSAEEVGYWMGWEVLTGKQVAEARYWECAEHCGGIHQTARYVAWREADGRQADGWKAGRKEKIERRRAACTIDVRRNIKSGVRRHSRNLRLELRANVMPFLRASQSKASRCS